MNGLCRIYERLYEGFYILYIMLLNHVKFVLQKYLNQCITPRKMLCEFDPTILKCKGQIRTHASVTERRRH